MKNIQKFTFDLFVWWFFYGYMPKEKDACREWLRKNLKNNVLPFVQWTETQADDKVLEIVHFVVDNDSAWDIVWSMYVGGETATDTIIDGNNDERSGLLQRIRERIGKQRRVNATVLDAVSLSSDEEAESVALVAVILSIIANGPLALANIKRFIERIRSRRNDR